MKLPVKLKVGYRNYKIEDLPQHEADARGLRGTHLSHSGVIRIERGMDTEQQANTLIHEILHACWSQCHLDEDIEEHTITVLTNQLTQVFQDNPEVTKYLRDALAKPT